MGDVHSYLYTGEISTSEPGGFFDGVSRVLMSGEWAAPNSSHSRTETIGGELIDESIVVDGWMFRREAGRETWMERQGVSTGVHKHVPEFASTWLEINPANPTAYEVKGVPSHPCPNPDPGPGDGFFPELSSTYTLTIDQASLRLMKVEVAARPCPDAGGDPREITLRRSFELSGFNEDIEIKAPTP